MSFDTDIHGLESKTTRLAAGQQGRHQEGEIGQGSYFKLRLNEEGWKGLRSFLLSSRILAFCTCVSSPLPSLKVVRPYPAFFG